MKKSPELVNCKGVFCNQNRKSRQKPFQLGYVCGCGPFRFSLVSMFTKYFEWTRLS